MDKIFNLTSTFKALESDDGSVMIRGMASTADFDRAGDSISAEAWQKGGLKNFEKNPIILFNHDYDRPIGRATGMKAGPNGLELECKISKNAPGNVAELVKDGVLGAFSVGFRVKDADYIKETDGLMIKDAELFEVSVVSVPCNQAATFSLSKSFDSIAEYEEFKKTFTNRVDLAGQSLAKDEVNTSSVASDAPQSVEKSTDQEIKMDNQNIDLEAFAKKVADETAAKIAMKQAEQKAAEKADFDAKAAQASAIEAQEIRIKTGIQTGVESLMADVAAKLAEKDAKLEEVLGKFGKDLEEKNAEIEAMRNSKRVFGDRSDAKGDLSKWGKDFMYAHMLGVMTGKGMNTSFARDLQQKAGISYGDAAAGDVSGLKIDQEVSSLIEKEIMNETKIAKLFREIQVNGASTILPIQMDVSGAQWNNNAASTDGTLTPNGGRPTAATLTAHRLISTTFMENEVDEQVLINLMPMLVESVARAHATSVEAALVNATTGGAEKFNGLAALATADASSTMSLGTSTRLEADMLLGMREKMGKYGINPVKLVYIVSQQGYFDLLNDPDFQTVTEVGSDFATRISGVIGAVYGTPVVVSEQFPTAAIGTPAAFAVYTPNYVIPRLRGVAVESDYEVMAQRRVIVATQSLGFSELVNGATGYEPLVRLNYIA
jgi:HK97 family phage prohead protease